MKCVFHLNAGGRCGSSDDVPAAAAADDKAGAVSIAGLGGDDKAGAVSIAGLGGAGGTVAGLDGGGSRIGNNAVCSVRMSIHADRKWSRTGKRAVCSLGAQKLPKTLAKGQQLSSARVEDARSFWRHSWQNTCSSSRRPLSS